MSQFESIHIQGFRRLVDVNLKLRPLMVMIGANGCGKTSLLEAWRLLAKSAEGRLSDTVSAMGGFGELITRPRTEAADVTDLSVAVRIKESPATQNSDDQESYSVRLVRAGYGFRIDCEFPRFKQDSGTPEDVFVQTLGTETQLSSAKGGPARILRETLSSAGYFRPFELVDLRRPQSVQPALLPGEHGEALVASLYSLRETDRDRFEVVEDWLRAAFPDFERLEFPPVAAGMLGLAWKDRHYSNPIYSHQFSNGTLRFLWLTALLSSRHLPAVTLIDEPEVSLHPQLLMLLVEMMREASMRTQIIVATQSESLVRFLKPEEILVADLEEGATKFTWGEELDLDHWLKDYSLNELWTMGVLGGRL